MVKSEKLTGARSSNRDAPGAKPSPQQSCSDVVNISVFFDDAGNNKDIDDLLLRWSKSPYY